jgi:hypothetical protein
LSTNEGPEQVELDGTDALPVVARMVIEIRSDGSRTIARGAVEDCINDQRVAVDARADSPLELSRALMKMLLSAPFSAGSALLGRTHDTDDTQARDTGLRSRARALRRSVGERLERSLQTRLRDAAKRRG